MRVLSQCQGRLELIDGVCCVAGIDKIACILRPSSSVPTAFYRVLPSLPAMADSIDSQPSSYSTQTSLPAPQPISEPVDSNSRYKALLETLKKALETKVSNKLTYVFPHNRSPLDAFALKELCLTRLFTGGSSLWGYAFSYEDFKSCFPLRCALWEDETKDLCVQFKERLQSAVVVRFVSFPWSAFRRGLTLFCLD